MATFEIRRGLPGEGSVRVVIERAGRELRAFCLTAWKRLPPGESCFPNRYLEWQRKRGSGDEQVLEHRPVRRVELVLAVGMWETGFARLTIAYAIF